MFLSLVVRTHNLTNVVWPTQTRFAGLAVPQIAKDTMFRIIHTCKVATCIPTFKYHLTKKLNEIMSGEKVANSWDTKASALLRQTELARLRASSVANFLSARYFRLFALPVLRFMTL